MAAPGVADLLRVLGPEPPRRAVLTAEGVREKSEAGGQEVDVLSAVCAVVRRIAGLPVLPLATSELATACITTNSARAWKALYDDIKTGDADFAAATAVLHKSLAAAVAALLAPKDAAHLLHVSSCLTTLVGQSPLGRDLGVLLGARLQYLADTLMRHGSIMRRDVRDAVLTSMGRLLAACEVPANDTVITVLRLLGHRQDDLLRLFLHIPMAPCLHLHPELAVNVLNRAKATPPAQRYPALALLARMSSAAADCLAGHEAVLVEVLASTLAFQLASPAGVDARTALVVSVLAQAAGAAAATLAPLLAQTLQHASASLIEKAKN